DQPYFDGRAECLVWATWARAWQGMDRSAVDLMHDCRSKGIDIYRYGADLPVMAANEQRQNSWAVRWLYLHIRRRGLCLRPPHSLVEHIGFDSLATNASDGAKWTSPPLRPCPPIPEQWPDAIEDRDCNVLWRRAFGSRPHWLPEQLRRVLSVLRSRTV